MSLKFQKRVESKVRRSCRVFNATDFQSLMYPCFTLCRIVGIFPYKINNSIFEASKPQYILSIIITCALCLLQLIMLYSVINFTYTKNFVTIIRFFYASCYSILINCVAIVTLVLCNSRMHLFQTIMEISSKLSPESFQKLSTLIHAKDILCFFCFVSHFVYSYVRTHEFLTITLLFYITLLVFTMDMTYMNCVCIIKACFKEINNNLLHMQEFIVGDEPRVPIIFYSEQRNQFLIKNLKALKEQHLKISNTVEKLNIIFCSQLSATIIRTFIEILFLLYVHVLQRYNVLGINIHEHIFDYVFIYMIYEITKIILLIWACDTCKNQAQDIRTTIHDVLNSSRDEQVKYELQLFSLQILHCENIFSAKGFNVDATFLATMVGTITTYMLIVLQFLIMAQSCDGKSATNIT